MSNNSKDIEQVVEKNSDRECFVIMPISDPGNYEKGHFTHVYEDLFKPAIEMAGFKPFRVDENNASSVIHLEIIKRLIEAPMALCDLSGKNPNVMYELGIRQAFDKPVVLVGDNNPGDIFDIGHINTYQYRKSLIYRDVIEDQKKIKNMIEETSNSDGNNEKFNSLISLLKVKSAAANLENKGEIGEGDLIKIMYNEILNIQSELKKIKGYTKNEQNRLLSDKKGNSWLIEQPSFLKNESIEYSKIFDNEANNLSKATIYNRKLKDRDLGYHSTIEDMDLSKKIFSAIDYNGYNDKNK